MTSIADAFDKIRLTRRKLAIAQTAVATAATVTERDIAVLQCVTLRDDLARALDEFAKAGFEAEVVRLIASHGISR